VLVGLNGAGKTSLLDAISIFLKWVGRYCDEGYAKPIIQISDISLGKKAKKILYQLEIDLCKNEDKGYLCVPFDVEMETEDSVTLSIPKSSDSIQQVYNTEKPVFAAYMAGRFISEKDFILKGKDFFKVLNDKYEVRFSRTIDYSDTLSWFDKADADEARLMRDSGNGQEMPELKAVREALSKALLGKYEKPSMYGNPPELVIYEKETEQRYKVSQLSDGYRSMLALVMDLARHMAQASEAKGKATEQLLQKKAIVLIDEIELHLHPVWQQTVLTTLMEIFPNTQFIVTTHSPQVLTSIQNKHIRILNDGKAYTFDEQTQGTDASKLLKRVFGVDVRPMSLDIVKTLTEYTKLVYSDKWDTSKAMQLRKSLDDHYGDDDTELSELDLHIENKKWEKGL
jgi:predicted ATP-binding protein involved in virulence